MGGAVLMITITDRSRCGEFAAWYQEQGIPLVLTALGSGTATTEILDCLGLEASYSHSRETRMGASLLMGSDKGNRCQNVLIWEGKVH